jgi:hypothetical protein
LQIAGFSFPLSETISLFIRFECHNNFYLPWESALKVTCLSNGLFAIFATREWWENQSYIHIIFGARKKNKHTLVSCIKKQGKIHIKSWTNAQDVDDMKVNTPHYWILHSIIYIFGLQFMQIREMVGHWSHLSEFLRFFLFQSRSFSA